MSFPSFFFSFSLALFHFLFLRSALHSYLLLWLVSIVGLHFFAEPEFYQLRSRRACNFTVLPCLSKTKSWPPGNFGRDVGLARSLGDGVRPTGRVRRKKKILRGAPPSSAVACGLLGGTKKKNLAAAPIWNMGTRTTSPV